MLGLLPDVGRRGREGIEHAGVDPRGGAPDLGRRRAATLHQVAPHYLRGHPHQHFVARFDARDQLVEAPRPTQHASPPGSHRFANASLAWASGVRLVSVRIGHVIIVRGRVRGV
jgi:hypothetical protein